MQTMTHSAINIESALRSLRDKLQDALWANNDALARAILAEIERLEMLQSYGETHDLPF